jgi:hypothetical protein
MYEGAFDFRLLLPQAQYASLDPVVPTPVFPPAAQPSEGPPPFAPTPTSTKVPEMTTSRSGDERNVPGKDPFYQRALAWANSQQGKESLAALAKGVGGGGSLAAPPPFRASQGHAASPDPTAHLKGQGKSMMDALMQQLGQIGLLQPMGKLGGKPGRRANTRYDILARGGG